MKRREVRYQESAVEGLQDIYLYPISKGASARSPRAYVNRIRESCSRMRDVPEGGRPRDDLAPGLRIWAFERRAIITDRLEPDALVIERVLYGGRDIDGLHPRSRRDELT